MKYLLTLHMTPALWSTLPEAAKQEIYAGHGAFMEKNAAEIIETKALAEPENSTIVRVRDGKVAHETGLLHGADTFFCGYYLVDVKDEDRARELAAQIPDAQYTAVEVRKVVHEA
ncbi:YciI family protein [Amycolatopsis sp. NPDC004368]